MSSSSAVTVNVFRRHWAWRLSRSKLRLLARPIKNPQRAKLTGRPAPPAVTLHWRSRTTPLCSPVSSVKRSRWPRSSRNDQEFAETDGTRPQTKQSGFQCFGSVNHAQSCSRRKPSVSGGRDRSDQPQGEVGSNDRKVGFFCVDEVDVSRRSVSEGIRHRAFLAPLSPRGEILT